MINKQRNRCQEHAAKIDSMQHKINLLARALAMMEDVVLGCQTGGDNYIISREDLYNVMKTVRKTHNIAPSKEIL